MFFTANQIVAHLVGDYIFQSHWMANEKTKRSLAAVLHALAYSLPFSLLSMSFHAWIGIVVTHYFIDRYRLARFVVAFKNCIFGPWNLTNMEYQAYVTATGYPADTPPWLAVWLLIIADNTMHLICNAVALNYL